MKKLFYKGKRESAGSLFSNNKKPVKESLNIKGSTNHLIAFSGPYLLKGVVC